MIFCVLGVNFEQRKWEEEQVNAAIMKFGASDAKEKYKNEKTYEYLLEDEITFVKSLQIPGKNNDKTFVKDEKEDKEDAATREKKSLQDTRKSLPIYAYRNSLLDAIRDNQIIVIEGETGKKKEKTEEFFIFITLSPIKNQGKSFLELLILG